MLSKAMSQVKIHLKTASSN